MSRKIGETETTDATFQELQTRVKKHRFYSRIGKYFPLIFIAVYVSAAAISFVITILINVAYPSDLNTFLLIFAMVFSSTVVILAVFKGREYFVDSDEWVRYYVPLICFNLDNYFETGSSGMKKNFRKRALNSAKDFLAVISDRWTVGLFKPSRDFVGNSVSNIVRNLRTKVIPVLQYGDDDSLRDVNQIMYNFSHSPKGLTVEGLNEINRQIDERLNKDLSKKGHFPRISAFMQTHKIVKHSVFMLGFVVICVVVGYGALVYGVSKDNVFIGCITLFGILMGGYLLRSKLPTP